MLQSYATGLLLIVAMAVAWVAVQNAWRRAFPGAATDPDVLAGRPGCRTCESKEKCGRRSDSTQEEKR
jgi:hypothetical protein